MARWISPESRSMDIQNRLSGPATSRLTGGLRTADRPAVGAAHALAPYAAAFRAVGVDRVTVNPARDTAGSTSPRLDNGPANGRLAQVTGHLAADFDAEYQRIKSDRPEIGTASAHAAAQYNTIMTYRSEFPRGEFSIRSPGGDGTAMRIPPAAATAPVTATPMAAAVTTGSAMTAFLPTTAPSVGLAAAQAHYAEWA